MRDLLTPRNPARVAVVPGATEVGLEIRRSLQHLKEVELESLGDPRPTCADLLFQRHHVVPRVGADGWLEAVRRTVSDHHIDVLYPAHDDWVVALSEARESISATVIASDAATVSLIRSKRRTYARLAATVRVPVIYPDLSACTFPCFIKPDVGQGSRGATFIADVDGLAGYAAFAGLSGAELFTSHVVCEQLPGPEYTVDCFSSKEGGLLHASARLRARTNGGISTSSQVVSRDDLRTMAEVIHEQLGLRGPWFFQAKEDDRSDLVLLEVAPRIAGTSGLTRVNGVNLPLLALYEFLDRPIDVLPGTAIEGVERFLAARYRSHFDIRRVYVDLDDTLVVKGRLNAKLVGILYQLLSSGASLYLLTRSTANVAKSLGALRLGPLFDDVFALTPSQRKSDFISPDGAVFIDDSFSERREVSRRLGIPTLDLSMIDCLIDFD